MVVMNVSQKVRTRTGFTLVEVTVIIVVIGILAGIVVVGYGAWRQRIVQDTLKSDLSGLTAGMENARNFDTGYPVFPSGTEFNGTNATKAIFVQTEGITLTYYSGDTKSYCIDARSINYTSIYFFLDTTGNNSTPKVGTCAGGEGAAPLPFNASWTVLTYDTRQPNCATTIYLPVTSPTSGGSIDWGDGASGTLTGALTSHTYSSEGEYIVAYSGPITTFNTASITTSARGCLKSVDQWSNTISPTTVRFENSTQLVATTQPPLSVTAMNSMFSGASAFNQPLNNWNTSNVTNMSAMFYNAWNFNQPLNNWNTANVTNMTSMFRNSGFNQNISNWNTSSVTDMGGMFMGTGFNQNISNWNTSSVTSMSGMFNGALNFNQPLNSWDVSNVSEFSAMFSGATQFNQPLSNWNTASASEMNYMFREAENFNQSLSSWDTSSVTTMRGMFTDASLYNQPMNSWDVSAVLNFEEMFQGATAFNQPINNWYTTALTYEAMFRNATSFNQDISNLFNGQEVEVSYMLYGASSFNQNLGPGYVDVSHVITSPPIEFDTGTTSWTLPKPVWP